MDPTLRFSDRVADYVRYRPGYPDGLFRTLEEDAGLGPGDVVADIGCGTGISAQPLLKRGYRVVGIEPNGPMRAAAEALLSGYPGFRAVEATAEATGLDDRSVELVVAGQAFHWFDPDRARAEFARILRPGGAIALFWNTRLVQETPFLRAYEALLHEFATDYAEVDHRQVDAGRMAAFFGAEPTYRSFPNRQLLDRAGLRGRLLSSSYVPAVGHARHEPMLAAMDALWDAHQHDGTVAVEYRTDLFLGRLPVRADGR